MQTRCVLSITFTEEMGTHSFSSNWLSSLHDLFLCVSGILFLEFQPHILFQGHLLLAPQTQHLLDWTYPLPPHICFLLTSLFCQWYHHFPVISHKPERALVASPSVVPMHCPALPILLTSAISFSHPLPCTELGSSLLAWATVPSHNALPHFFHSLPPPEHPGYHCLVNLAWKIPWTEEPGRLQFMGSRTVRHDWATSLSLFTFMYWRRKWQPTPVFLPGESQGQGSLVGCHLWGRTESDTTEAT